MKYQMSGLKNTKHHYVYRITNIRLKKYYYGVRSCSCLPIEDLGIRYFSSSTDEKFMNDQKEHPEDYKYKIVKEFDNRKDAEYFEKYLHTKFNVSMNEHFYNKCMSTLMGFSVEGTHWTKEHHKNMEKVFESYRRPFEERYGPERAKEIKEKLRRPKTDERKKKISESKMGKKLSDSHKAAMSIAIRKRYASMSDEERENFRKKMTEVNRSEDKRKKDSEQLKAIWADPVRSKELWGNRNPHPSYVIKMTRPDGSSETFKGFCKMCESNKFQMHIVRKALKDGKPIKDYPTRSHNNAYVNLSGYKFELLGEEI